MLRARSEVRGRESRARMEAQERAAMREAIRATSERATSRDRELKGHTSHQAQTRAYTDGTGQLSFAAV